MEVKAVTKEAKVIEFGKVGTEIAPGKGDCNKDDDLTALDALCALKMSVGKMQTHESIDVDEDGKVTFGCRDNTSSCRWLEPPK